MGVIGKPRREIHIPVTEPTPASPVTEPVPASPPPERQPEPVSVPVPAGG
jgi:hypothetical protein